MTTERADADLLRVREALARLCAACELPGKVDRSYLVDHALSSGVIAATKNAREVVAALDSALAAPVAEPAPLMCGYCYDLDDCQASPGSKGCELRVWLDSHPPVAAPALLIDAADSLGVPPAEPGK